MAEWTLGDARQESLAVVDSVADYAIFLLDRDGRVRTWNKGARLIKLYEPDEIIGSHISRFYPEEDRQGGRPERLLAIAAAEGRVEDEGWRIRKDGTRFWADVVITAIRDPGGAVLGFLKVTRDLTERRQAETQVKHSEQQLRMLIESVEDYAIFMLDRTGQILTWNTGAERLKGYSPAEAIGQSLEIFYPPADREAGKPRRLLQIAAELGRVEDEGWRLRKTGEPFWADVVINRVLDDKGALVGFAKITRDLTIRRAAELALRRSEQSLASTLYSIGDGVIATDETGRITRVNRVAERLTGWTEAAAIGEPFETVFNIISETTREVAASPARRVLTEGVIVGLANHTALIARDGTERPIADSGAPIRDAAGNTLGVVVVFRDLTSERQTEYERMRAVRAEEAVRERDIFLSVAAHELRTPLTSLQLKLDGIKALVERHVGGEIREKLAARFDDTKRQTSRIVELTERLLDLSRVATVRLVLEREDLDLGVVLARVAGDVRETAKAAGTELRVTLGGDLRGHWDRRRLEQVVINLTTNAIKYGAGRPVDLVAISEPDAVALQVIDRGIGIAPHDLGRIFAPFERATPVEHFTGLGLGLYITKGIVESHGGTIAVKSEIGHGSTFEIRLPRSA
jgi:PAS domain S-box-containing protein